MLAQQAMYIISEYKMVKRNIENEGADLMKIAIKKSGLSLRRFADKHGYSPTYICKIRKGDFKMSMPVFEVICKNHYIGMDSVISTYGKV
jgi:hypothetical protein